MLHQLRLVILSGVLLCGVVWAADGAQVTSETLLQTSTSWDGTAYKSYPAGTPQISVLKITIPPNTALPWHSHPMPNAAYVLSGDLSVEKKETGQTVKLSEGQVLPELVGSLHRGTSGAHGVQLIVFYAGAPGMPLSEKEK